MIPTECKMPDLSDLELGLKKYLLLRAFMDNPGVTKKQRLYRSNFVRLVDKAVKEYHEARKSITAQMEEVRRPAKELEKGRILYILDFTDHFETCVNALNRLLKQLDVIKNETSYWKISRPVRNSIVAHSRLIPDIRDAAEHMEEHIRGDEVNGPVMLMTSENGDKAIIGEYEIKFSDVATALRRLHQIACDLCSLENITPGEPQGTP